MAKAAFVAFFSLSLSVVHAADGDCISCNSSSCALNAEKPYCLELDDGHSPDPAGSNFTELGVIRVGAINVRGRL